MESLKYVLEKHGYWPFVLAGLLFLTVPPVVIHYATANRGGPTPNPVPPTAAGPAVVKASEPNKQTVPNPSPDVPGPGKEEAAPDPVRRVVKYDRVVAESIPHENGGLTPGELKLEKVEYLSAGGMRWHFACTGKAETRAYLSWPECYAADDKGERLDLGEKSTGGGLEAYLPLKPDLRTRFWIQTSDPVAGARSVTFFLKPTFEGVRFQVPLP